MRVWCDAESPEQMPFLEHVAARLGEGHRVLLTPPGEAGPLGGGAALFGRLRAETRRMERLLAAVAEFAPEAAVSCASAVAARISFGLGVRHLSFCEGPSRRLRTVAPLLQKMLVPSVVPAGAFSRYGIDAGDIVRYGGVPDAFARWPEAPPSGGAVVVEEGGMPEVIGPLRDEFPRVVTADRNGGVPGDALLFVGHGRMVARAALAGVPTISYGRRPDAIQRYLARSRLVAHRTGLRDILRSARRMAGSSNAGRAGDVISRMEDPCDTLLDVIVGG